MTGGEVAFRTLLNLADQRLGAAIVAASDQFFGPAEALISPAAPVYDPTRYTDYGKWMDGWETRRRRGPGHDWCIIRLGAAAVVRGVDVDTTHFRGNHPERATVEAATSEVGPWTTIVPEFPLEPNGSNLSSATDAGRWSHIRLQIHPDGGVARFRVYGEPQPDWEGFATGVPVDLAAALHGGCIVACNDAFFGAAASLLLPGPSAGMMDGWETRRRRGTGYDWVVVRLGASGRIVGLEVDTSHFKGNCPESCAVAAADFSPDGPIDLDCDGARWTEILAPTRLTPDRVHRYDISAVLDHAVSHVRLEIHPDGGIARFRVLGLPLFAS